MRLSGNQKRWRNAGRGLGAAFVRYDKKYHREHQVPVENARVSRNLTLVKTIDSGTPFSRMNVYTW